jgi:hypothetical protein
MSRSWRSRTSRCPRRAASRPDRRVGRLPVLTAASAGFPSYRRVGRLPVLTAASRVPRSPRPSGAARPTRPGGGSASFSTDGAGIHSHTARICPAEVHRAGSRHALPTRLVHLRLVHLRRIHGRRDARRGTARRGGPAARRSPRAGQLGAIPMAARRYPHGGARVRSAARAVAARAPGRRPGRAGRGDGAGGRRGPGPVRRRGRRRRGGQHRAPRRPGHHVPAGRARGG